MQMFHKNKDRRSKYQNKNEFPFMSPALLTNVNRIVFTEKQYFYRMFLLDDPEEYPITEDLERAPYN